MQKKVVNFREKEKEVLDDILGPGRYDARIRPSGENGTGEYMNVLFLRPLFLPVSLPKEKKRKIDQWYQHCHKEVGYD